MSIRMILGKVLSVMVCLLLIAGYAEARNGNGGNAPVSGTIVCGGYYNITPDYLNPTQRFRVIMRNINEQADIKIERVRLYYRNGEIAFDTNDYPGMFPDGRYGILGWDGEKYNNILGPHQTEAYWSENDIFIEGGYINPDPTENVQIVINWSSTSKATPLKVGLVRHIYNQSGTLLARSSGKCDDLQ